MCSRKRHRQRSEPHHSKIKDALLVSGMCLFAHLFSWRVDFMGEVTTLRAHHATDCSGPISIPPACLCGAWCFYRREKHARPTTRDDEFEPRLGKIGTVIPV
jgi:hypothetical protein